MNDTVAIVFCAAIGLMSVVFLVNPRLQWRLVYGKKESTARNLMLLRLFDCLGIAMAIVLIAQTASD